MNKKYIISCFTTENQPDIILQVFRAFETIFMIEENIEMMMSFHPCEVDVFSACVQMNSPDVVVEVVVIKHATTSSFMFSSVIE